jgi:hypothetical protein
VVQVSIETDAFASTPATLTAAAQVLTQPLPHEVIEIPECLARIAQLEVVGPALEVSVKSLNQFR